jgi:L-threonylcarbamoyladenylate synthase
MNEEFLIDDAENAVNVLRQGGIILYPTDTIWGIGCDATNALAVERIIVLKQRPPQKSFVVLAASEKDILQYTASPDLAVFDHLQTVTKPTTVIYENALSLAENVVNEDGSVAIRICSDAFCRYIIKRLRKPLVSTSANVSGEIPPANFDEISNIIKQGVDYIVQYRQHDKSRNTASSIIRWKNGAPQVIRP